jgi:hypothetical protein
MPRNMNRRENEKRAKVRRSYALERFELRGEPELRANAASPTAMAVKVNPDAAAIEAFLAQRRGGQGGTK